MDGDEYRKTFEEALKTRLAHCPPQILRDVLVLLDGYEASRPLMREIVAPEKCLDCGAIMIEVCSGLEDMTIGARSCRAETGWQPIETAPKDGKPLLLLDIDEPVTIVGFWRGEWLCQWDEEPIVGMTWEYWMPLPKSPLSQIEDGKA